MSVLKIIGSRTSKINGLLLINMKSNYFCDTLKNIRISPNGYVIILSKDGMLLTKDVKQKFLIEKSGLDFLKKNIGNSGSFYETKKNGDKLLITYNILKTSKWYDKSILL